jgi:fibronectin-binding autotransporter adhesin
VTINGGAVLNGGNANAISLSNNATITVGAGGSVTNNASSSGGLWNAGRNTIEFDSNGSLIVQAGGSVRATGTSTNAEAINLIGTNNTVVNYGLISGLNSAAIWFEDRALGSNTIDNYGTIQRGSGGNGSVLANVIGNQSNSDVNFINRTGAVVYGGLSFAGGSDTLTLFPGSVISGGFNGGGGTNTLRLEGAQGSSDTLPGNISNFQTLTKAGAGRWTLSGTIGSNGGGTPLAVQVQQGTLALTGNNTNFNGSIVVDAAGTLEARAQSLPPSVTDNGLVHFTQPDNGTYTGTLSGSGSVLKTGAGVLTMSGVNSYQGSTVIREGAIAIGSNSGLGGPNGALTLDGGELQIGSSFDLSAARAITVTANNGAISTGAGVVSQIVQGITGPGTLTSGGSGRLILAGANTYAGGTTISAGTLQLGNGGTAGSIVGDVANNGVLAFNRSDQVTIAGTISGGGSVVHSGSGVTFLSGNNSYSGTTTISNGWLYVDGNQSLATGALTTASGTRLGGNGTVGGDVIIADGATLAPGAQPQVPATLTIAGDLTLNPTSNLFYNMVQANVAGGQLNDLINVGGGLVLDGVVNVADQGQTLGPGVYRIINYGGTLTDHGLTIGSFMTAPASPQEPSVVTGPLTGFTVQTSIPGQVNLVNTGGLALNYWDVAPKNNNAINGGTGTWQASPGTANDNWTGSDGQFNAPWQDGAYAIFMGSSGTVTVDNTAGAVASRGMQFATDGYSVIGAPITLLDSTTGNVTFIRVGDGTPAGLGMTATIDASLVGNALLVKDDQGTLVLNGVNTYTNGTAVSGGTLRISQDANLGATGSALAIVNGATLQTTASFATGRQIIVGTGGSGASGGVIQTDAGTQLTANGAIVEIPMQPPGSLTKTGAGTLVLNAANTYTGGTVVAAGTLQVGSGNNTGSILGDVATAGGAVLAFDRNDPYAFAGVVSGAGELRQIGTGTTILTNDNTYTGGTTVSAGTLQLGNGGTTGSIVGDVANNGVLAFNRSDQVTIAGTISGGGSVVHSGSGVTFLSGNNSYSGTTTISNGWLYVDGNQSLATGALTTASGTRLGGNGTVGGDVIIADGATLAPGAQPQVPATLTIAGDLTLNPTSNLFYNMVQANVAGGQLNDLINVGGGLVLDGVVNVADQGQTLGPGVYRIINYGGTLTDHGLTIGSFMTAPASPQEPSVVTGPLTGFTVQTSIPGQVNLVNTGGLALNYWDVAPKNNNAINGGTGTWQASPGTANDNWTGSDGQFNAPWQDGAYAIFMGSSGTVTVDNTAGAVASRGMQFATDGYSVIGAPITLLDSTTGNVTFIRVGDGTPAGLGMTATIDASLVGNALLVKDDQGTLVLNGVNTYTNGTAVSGGTLRISQDANLGATGSALAIVNGATLQTTASFATGRQIIVGTGGSGASGGVIQTDAGTQLTANGAIVEIPMQPPGSLTKTGAGTLVLNAANTYTGGTVVAAGTLQVGSGNNTGSILGDVATAGGAVLAFDRNDPYAFAGVVSGAGELRQIGTGTTILTNDNTYTGGTTVSAGTLQLGNGGTTGSIVGDVANNGVLAFNRSDTYVFGGLVSGGGALVQAGPGTTVLTADNAYTGGTTIAQGTLQLGNGGATGAIVGNVANNGTIVFNRSGAPYTYAGVISGGGQLVQAGPGTTVLTGENTYTGNTAIVAGVLQLGDGGNSGSIQGDVVDNAALSVNRSDTVILPGQITGSGIFVQQGPGTTILTGNSTYSGGTAIADGTLQLGNGGDAGSVFGDIAIAGGATLAFNRDNLQPIVGNISGAGDVIQRGTGNTVLFGTNSYLGTTDVASGGLYVNGDQGAATGMVTVGSAATLGGMGTIGGNVSVASGGILAPGDTGAAPGTLTIRQGLALNAASVLDYQFGEANVVGGAFNDLTAAEGNLTLGGTLNVNLTEGGTFEPGIYRIISYGGTLTNNGLALGTLPAGGSPVDYFIQTAIAQQVNLAYTSGLPLNFWDGDAGPKGEGRINGGNGTWQALGSFDNWTNAFGMPNAAWADSAFAIFSGQSGTVDVSDDLGDVRAAGMQFAADGYRIQGGPIVLMGPDAVIRVGDGTSLGSAYTATIDSELAGTARLIKSDIGTLVLTGDNSYTGGTAINGGVLQISRDANLGADGTPLFLDDGALRTTADMGTDRAASLGPMGGIFETAAGTQFTYAGVIGGPGTLTKTGGGMMVLAQENGYAGGTWIKEGTLQIASDANLGQAGTDLTLQGGTLHTTANIASGRAMAIDVAGGTVLTDAGTTYTQNGVLMGLGNLVKGGAGTFALAGDGSGYGGTATVAAGTLAVDGVLGGYQVLVGQGARLEGNGQVRNVVNSGTVAPGRSIGTLTINGDYVSNGGGLEIETVLGGDASPTDRLVVTGNTQGSTDLVVINRNGLGAPTAQGIKIIDVGGASNGVFTLHGDYSFQGQPAVVAGAYSYRLYKNGVDTPNDGDWYLRSAATNPTSPDAPGNPGTPGEPPPPLYQPGVPVYESYAKTLLALNGLPTLEQRIGNRRWGAASVPDGTEAWARLVSGHQRFDPASSTSGAKQRMDTTQLQFGVDHMLKRGAGGSALIAGINFRYGDANDRVDSVYGDGRIRSQGYGLGTSLTWYGQNGYYVDGQAQLSWYDSDLKSDELGSRAKGNKGSGHALGAEVGRHIDMGAGYSLTPQAQVVYSSVDFDSFTDSFGARVSSGKGDSLKTRIGVSVDRQDDWSDTAGKVGRSKLYGVASVSYEWLDGTSVKVSGTDIRQRDQRLWGEVGLGGSYTWKGGRYTVYSEVSAATPLDDPGRSSSVKALAGIRVRF